jgi:hypothetical protein
VFPLSARASSTTTLGGHVAIGLDEPPIKPSELIALTLDVVVPNA